MPNDIIKEDLEEKNGFGGVVGWLKIKMNELKEWKNKILYLVKIDKEKKKKRKQKKWI